MGPTSAATPPPPPPQQQPPHPLIPRPSAADNRGPSPLPGTPHPLPPQPPLLRPDLDDPDDAFPAGSAYNYGTWTAADDRTLLAARARGTHWGELQVAHFPSKTANACRKRHERLMERRGAAHDGGGVGDARRFEKIASEYMAMRRQIWGGLAERVQERWEFVEREVSLFFFFWSARMDIWVQGGPVPLELEGVNAMGFEAQWTMGRDYRPRLFFPRFSPLSLLFPPFLP